VAFQRCANRSGRPRLAPAAAGRPRCLGVTPAAARRRKDGQPAQLSAEAADRLAIHSERYEGCGEPVRPSWLGWYPARCQGGSTAGRPGSPRLARTRERGKGPPSAWRQAFLPTPRIPASSAQAAGTTVHRNGADRAPKGRPPSGSVHGRPTFLVTNCWTQKPDPVPCQSGHNHSVLPAAAPDGNLVRQAAGQALREFPPRLVRLTP